jgi:hypothetical protein
LVVVLLLLLLLHQSHLAPQQLQIRQQPAHLLPRQLLVLFYLYWQTLSPLQQY